MLKYSSIAIRKPARSKRFSKFPKPKYLRIRKIIKPPAVKSPRLEFANRVEKVKRSAKKTVTKNIGIAPKETGLIK